MLGMPEGRFYYTGEHRFGKGYQLVIDDPKHTKERKRFTKFLEDFPPITADHPYWQTKRGKRFLKEYTSENRSKNICTIIGIISFTTKVVVYKRIWI
ncbi:MAG: hypothetical protein CM15mP32_2510 [Flavobacteriaceae bacterium]|nr:MAG: hypothetical protein CM15mP32_2510 [Flavobacteriaceae bacterium]